MAFPPPPVSTIDWSNVGFKVREGISHNDSFPTIARLPLLHYPVLNFNSQWTYRVPLLRPNRCLVPSHLRKRPLSTPARHGTRHKLRPTSLRRHESFPLPKQYHNHLPPRQERQTSRTLRLHRLHSSCPRVPLSRMRASSCLLECGIRTSA